MIKLLQREFVPAFRGVADGWLARLDPRNFGRGSVVVIVVRESDAACFCLENSGSKHEVARERVGPIECLCGGEAAGRLPEPACFGHFILGVLKNDRVGSVDVLVVQRARPHDAVVE